MDINCTYHCEHQTNGKCNLMDVEHPYMQNAVSVSDPSLRLEENDADCPYYNWGGQIK